MAQRVIKKHLRIHNDVRQLSELAGFVDDAVAGTDLDKSLVLAINLALEEAVTNVVLYAYPEGTDGLVDIEAILQAGALTFVVSDSGSPFDPTAKPDADISLGVEDRPIGGLGIFLVRQIMDSVSYEYTGGKNILTMTKNI